MGIKVQRRQKHPPRSDGQARPAAAGWMSSGRRLVPMAHAGAAGVGGGRPKGRRFRAASPTLVAP